LLIAAQPVDPGIPAPAEFKVIPHVDQSHLYKEVTASLAQGTCICLFPEGGSHDRADLLPLKAGVAVMALSAMAEMRKIVCNAIVKIIKNKK
jgi:1-acyl-sn-glycerol-3-phosphate acyltransferase